MIPDDYEYIGNDGVTYHGVVAFVLNHIDSAQASCRDNIPDMMDGTFDADALVEEIRIYDAMSYIIDHPGEFAPYI